MSRERIGQDLGRKLLAAEVAIDRAVAEIAVLAAALPDARLRASLSATTAQPAFDGVAASLAALTEARGHLCGTHRNLAALARRLGMDVLAAGPVEKPEDGPPTGETGRLRAIVVNQT